ncbi:MAG: AbrB family transcriptional regulator [Pseudomonadota bacterium]
MLKAALRDVWLLVPAFAVGALGAGLFFLIGFPVAALTGSALAVAVAALCGLQVNVPTWLRNITFLTLGINIGSGITPEVLSSAVTWPLSFVSLAVMLLAGLFTARALLHRLFGFDRETALLCSTPGHLSYVLSFSIDSGKDVTIVTVVQCTRILLLTICLPPLITFVFGATQADFLSGPILGLVPGIILFLLSGAVGAVFLRLRLPAAYLLAGMAMSGLGHAADLAPGRFPTAMLNVALIAMGTLIASRLTNITFSQFLGALLAGVTVTTVMLFYALLGAVLMLWLLGLPLTVTLAAYAPGAVEAMAAIALQSGLDPPFVAAHHVFRLLILTILVPLLLHRWA